MLRGGVGVCGVGGCGGFFIWGVLVGLLFCVFGGGVVGVLGERSEAGKKQRGGTSRRIRRGGGVRVGGNVHKQRV